MTNDPSRRPDPTRADARLPAAVRIAGLVGVGALLIAALAAWQPPFPSTLSADTSSGLAEGSPAGAPLASGRTGETVRQKRDADPALANLDPDLAAALRRATDAAADDGVALQVNSGWRSEEHQQRLLEEAIAEYGSEEEAARWVATPETSSHVSGDAVDIGGEGATDWLAEYGADFGLCQIYDNEPWHFELRPYAASDGCPATYADPSHDPRMQQ